MPLANGTTWDPLRPIEPRGERLNHNECVHPWARLAIIMNERGSFKFQCFDCGAFLYVNGYPLVFDYGKE